MGDIIKIEDEEMQIREYNGQRVVTFKDIDLVHQNKSGTSKRNFTRNKKHFVENEDFILITREKFKGDNLSLLNIEVPTRGITVLTESGYLLIAKSFTDDLSWQVQRRLVNEYFLKRESTVQNQATVKLPYHTSDTPIPRNPSFYERNKRRMYKLCKAGNVPISFLYHNILKRVGEEFDLSAAEKIYEKENGHKPQYPMDMVDYFSDLSTLAEVYLDKIEKITLK